MTTKIFRTLILVSLALSIANVVSEIMSGSQLPESLRTYKESIGATPTPGLLAGVLLAFSVILLGLIGTIGLLFFWRPARILYSIATIAAFPLSFAFGPIVSTEWTHFFTITATCLGGVLWALMFFSQPIVDEFEDSGETEVPA